NKCREILIALIDAFIKRFFLAVFIQRLLRFIGKPLSVRCFVMQDSNFAVFIIIGDIFSGNNALLVITAAGTERIPKSALGIGGVGGARRDHQYAIFSINF